MLQTTTPEQRRAENAKNRARHFDMLTKLITSAEIVRAQMGPRGADFESEEYRDLVRAMYDFEPSDDLLETINEIESTLERMDPDYRDALGFSYADGCRIKDDRNRVDY